MQGHREANDGTPCEWEPIRILAQRMESEPHEQRRVKADHDSVKFHNFLVKGRVKHTFPRVNPEGPNIMLSSDTITREEKKTIQNRVYPQVVHHNRVLQCSSPIRGPKWPVDIRLPEYARDFTRK